MCGRYKLDISWREINALYGITNMPPDDGPENRPRYNIAPTTQVPVITSANGRRSLELMRWGLISSWSKDAKAQYATFNARADA